MYMHPSLLGVRCVPLTLFLLLPLWRLFVSCPAPQGFPSGASTLWVGLFHCGILSILGLYLLFWTKLNLAQTTPLVLAAGLFTAGG